MKKTIFFISLILLVSSIFVYVKYAPSYKIYRQAVELYEKGEIRKAYKKAQEAVNTHKLNRKAILLQAKLHKIVTSEDNYTLALNYYRKSMQHFFDEDYPVALNEITQSYDALDKIPSDAPIYPKAMELKKKVDKEIDNIRKKLPSLYYKKALKMAQNKNYISAYEFLKQIENKDEKTINLMDKLAYKIGTKSYSKIISNTDKVSNYEISDAIYWLSKVSNKSPSYQTAQKEIKILKNLLDNTKK